jgi:hypothetical protein
MNEITNIRNNKKIFFNERLNTCSIRSYPNDSLSFANDTINYIMIEIETNACLKDILAGTLS